MSGDSPVGVATQSSGPPEAERPPLSKDVFISYASQDAAVANSVVEALERQGIRCWIAPRDVTPGEFYADAIVHAIDAAQALVLVLSQHAAVSHHILREVERASSKRHPVISLRIDRATLPAGLEYFLNTSQWLDAGEGELSQAFPKLEEAVRKALIGAAATSGGNASASKNPLESTQGPRRRSRRPVAAVLGLVALAILGFAIDKWWSSRHIEEKPVEAAAPAVPVSTPAIPEKSVAVLPFVDMSEKKDQEYFSDGLSEELIDMLTKVSDLRVPARTSSFYFKGKQATIADIAKALSVSHVLEGSVRKSGKTLRITAQLIRVDNGYHVWSETYDRKLDDIFKVQDEIAGAVVAALKVSLLESGAPRRAPTSNMEAYTLYLQARAIATNAAQQSDVERAIDHVERALKLDPTFAHAWAALAHYRAYDYEYFTSGNYQQVFAEARNAAERALKLDPKLSDAHLAMGQLLFDLKWNWTAAESEIKQALALDPGNAEAFQWESAIVRTLGHFDEALQLGQSAVARDPLDAWNYGVVGNALRASGNLIEAEGAYRQALDLAPTMAQLHIMLGWLLVQRGDPAAALKEIEQETDESYREIGRALALDALGRKSEADRALAIAEIKYAGKVQYPIAVVYANRNDRDKAFAWLDRAYRSHDGWVPWVTWDPSLKNLTSDPRYTAYIHRISAPQP
jgi:TolB-like protein/Flp pilus assembly protein TadD